MNDARVFARMNACSEVSEFFLGPLTLAESNALLEKVIDHKKKYGFSLYAVYRKDREEFIGFTGLFIPSFEAYFTPAIEIGWRFVHKEWGNGFATEPALAICDYSIF